MALTDPKVSVIMAAYNCEATIDSALDSILNQTYHNWDLASVFHAAAALA